MPKKHEPTKDFAALVKELKPSILIGASAVKGAFTSEILESVAETNERPIIFALSNPTDKAECTAEEAYVHTKGKCVFASGSPFKAVTFNGITYHPGQSNNAYVFPGIALGVIVAGVHHIGEDLFLIAAQTIANHVTDQDLNRGSLYPPLSEIRKCSIEIASNIAEYAYKQGIASTYPEPKNKREHIESQLYDHYYRSSLPVTYQWPKLPFIETREMVPTKLQA